MKVDIFKLQSQSNQLWSQMVTFTGSGYDICHVVFSFAAQVSSNQVVITW